MAYRTEVVGLDALFLVVFYAAIYILSAWILNLRSGGLFAVDVRFWCHLEAMAAVYVSIIAVDLAMRLVCLVDRV